MNLPRFLRILLARVSPPCNEITLLISKGIDTRLTLRERLRLCLHFIICSGCNRFNIQIQSLHEILRESFGSTSDVIDKATAQIDETTSDFPEAMPKEARVRIQTALTAAIGEQ